MSQSCVNAGLATEMSLADPLPDILDNICCQLVLDGPSLLALGAVNRFWRTAVRDPALWDRLNALRFGRNPVAFVPEQPATAVPGWCFFSGLDSPGNDCASPADAKGRLHPTELAARADELCAVAFNTQGWIKSELLPKFRWNRYSYTPGVGLYVREEAVTRVLGCALPPPLPQYAEPQARPPEFPGWVFYQLMDSPGGDIRQPANGDLDFTSSCATLEELADVATRMPGCVAFNTSGHLKHTLRPQVYWCQDGGTCSWAGMYVRHEVVETRGLRRPLQGNLPDPCLRYFQLGKTCLLAAGDVDVVWLNGTYLSRTPDPTPELSTAATGAAPAAPTEVVRLNHVCWLELGGRFSGIGPGGYRCIWVLQVAPDCNVSELNFRITLLGARPLGKAALTASAAASCGSSGSNSDVVPSPGASLDSSVVRHEQLMRHAGPQWYEQAAGMFEVPTGAVYDVEVKLWDHSGVWKRGLWFKELILKRLEERQEDGWPGNVESMEPVSTAYTASLR